MAANLEFSPRAHGAASSSFFFRLIEDLGQSLEPTQTQLQNLERSYTSTAKFLVACPEFDANLVEVHAHGSRELGTITRPRSRRDGFDVDLIARFSQSAWQIYGAPGGARLLLDQLYNNVKRYADQHGLKLHKWQRCVTLEYTDGMCADIAPVIDHANPAALYGEHHGQIPDRELRGFFATNPRGFTKYFNDTASIAPLFDRAVIAKALAEDFKRADIAPLADADQVFNRLLCRLVQILKLHRDTAFSNMPALEEMAPSSIFLTALAAKSYSMRAPVMHSDPLDLFLDVIRTMPDAIEIKGRWNDCDEWWVANPTAPLDNLASSMNSSEKQQAFRQWHAKVASDIREIIDAIEGRQGVDRVGSLVTSAFGDTAGAASRQGQLERQTTLRQAGKVVAVSSAGLILPMTAKANTFFGE